MSQLKNVRNRRSDSLAKISWQDFESLLARYYESQGYHVGHVGTANTNQKFDGGIDLKLYKDDEYLLVQCKHWNAKQVPHNDVHQLIGLRVNESATGAVLISSGEFTQAAKLAARKGGITLIDGEELRGMLGNLMPQVVGDSTYSNLTASTISSNAKDMLRKGTSVVLNEADKRVTKHINHIGSRAVDILIWKLLLPIFLFITFIIILYWALNMTSKSLSASSRNEVPISVVSQPANTQQVRKPQ